jgi:hypothetical protein
MQQTSNVTPPQTGTLVFGSDGEEIGEITDVQAGFFQLKKGLIFRKDVYLPLDAITGTALGGDGVTINLTKDEVENGDWSEPPIAADETPQS